MKFNLKKPCNNCPFRKNSQQGWLGEERADEVANYAFQDSTFACHKTTGVEKGKEIPTDEHSQCAGAMILLDKEQGIYSNMLFRLANRLFNFNPNQLEGYDLVFDNRQEMIEHHAKEEELW